MPVTIRVPARGTAISVGKLPLKTVEDVTTNLTKRTEDGGGGLGAWKTDFDKLPKKIKDDSSGFDKISAFKMHVSDLLGAGHGKDVLFVVHAQNAGVDEMRLYDAHGTKLAHGQENDAGQLIWDHMVKYADG